MAGAAKDWVLGSRPAATTALGKARNAGGAAMTAAGRVTGGLQVADTLRNNFDAMQNLARDENSGVSDYLAGGVEFIGNTVASGGAALSSKFPALGPVAAGFIGSDGASRFIDKMDPGASVLRRHGLGGESKVPGASVVPGLAEAVGTIAPARDAGAGRGFVNPSNAVPSPTPDAQNAASAPRPGEAQRPEDSPDVGRITRNGNEYSGGIVGGGGNITINGFAPGAGLSLGSGPNAQNEAIWQRMADRSQAESMARVQGGMGGGGGGGGGSSAPQMPQAPTVLHSGNSWQARNDLRNAMVSATSIMNDGGKWDRHKGVSPERAYAAGLAETDAKLRGAQPGVDVATLQSNNSLRGSLASADASRYGSDNSLRGTVYTADSTRAGQMATARSAQQQLAYTRQRDARKDAMDAEKHDQTVGHNADSNARNDTRVFGPDGKVNEGMSAARYDVANQLFPGYGQMDEASRKAVNPDVKEMLGIFDRVYENKQMGFSKLNPLDPRDPQRSAMPNFQGGTLKKQGPEGYLTPGGEMGGYYVTDAEGNDIPLGKLNDRQIELVKRQIKTGSWTDKKEGK